MKLVANLSLVVLAIFILLQIADVVTTYLNLKRPDRAEANKFIKSIMDKIGILPALIITKAIVIGLFVGAYIYAGSIYLAIAMGVVCVFYVWVIINNARMLAAK